MLNGFLLIWLINCIHAKINFADSINGSILCAGLKRLSSRIAEFLRSQFIIQGSSLNLPYARALKDQELRYGASLDVINGGIYRKRWDRIISRDNDKNIYRGLVPRVPTVPANYTIPGREFFGCCVTYVTYNTCT